MDVHDREWGALDWGRLVTQIRHGDCTPFLGAGACTETLPSGAELSRMWAERYGYPFDDDESLAEVMQYASISEGDPVVVKHDVAEKLAEYGEPDYTSPTCPHTLLAEYPITVFLTTNYDDFMTRALQRVGKRPVTAACPWYRGAEIDPLMALPPGYEPTEEQPLVYHLHGNAQFPPAFVLPSQDYVEFLVSLAQDLTQDDRRIVPLQILPALIRRPLLFIGYSLRDPNFRMLYHGFVDKVADVQKRRHISVQLPPELEADEVVNARAKTYLNRYFEKLNIAVYWGTASEFCAELGRRLR